MKHENENDLTNYTIGADGVATVEIPADLSPYDLRTYRKLGVLSSITIADLYLSTGGDRTIKIRHIRNSIKLYDSKLSTRDDIVRNLGKMSRDVTDFGGNLRLVGSDAGDIAGVPGFGSLPAKLTDLACRIDAVANYADRLFSF